MTSAVTLNSIQKSENNSYVAESYTGIYSMHKYWSKKPFNIIRDFVLKYSHDNEIVFDPFCGSGTAITESIFAGRKALGVDINPVAIFITKQMLRRISSAKLLEEFRNLESECKDKINSLYLVKRGDEQFVGTHFLWENGKLAEVWYNTRRGRNGKVIDTPTDEDIGLAMSFSYEEIPYYYPRGNFFQNSRINADRNKHIYDLFTPRNLFALSFLLDRIERIEDKDIKDILRFCFTASVGQASKMVFVVKNRGKFNGKVRKTGRKDVGSWVIGYWVPKEDFEINVWNCFENKYRKTFAAKKEQESMKYDFKEAANFTELTTTSKNLLLVCDSAMRVLADIPDNSIDYIITDPPHGNRMPFLEQSMMWNEWLKEEVNYEDEIVISDSKDRNKDINNYYLLLGQVLKNIERVLKPNRHFSLMFNSLDDDTWINLIKVLSNLDLDLHAIETLGYSANSVVQDNREGGLKTDFIFTFKKNPNRMKREIKLYTLEEHEDFFVKMIDEYIANSKNGLQIYEILNNMVTDLLKRGIFFELSSILDMIRKGYRNEDNKWVKSG